MKGFLTALLVFVSTGMVYAQQSQNNFTSRRQGQQDSFSPQSGSGTRSGFSPQSNSAPLSNQTRLAALQSSSRVDADTSNYVIVDDGVDLPQGGERQRSFIGPENNPLLRDTGSFDRSNRNTSNHNTGNSNISFGNSITRSATQEQPRFSAQSSQRSATSVLPPRNNRVQRSDFQDVRNGNDQITNFRHVSNQSRPVSSIFDLHLTPEYEHQLKQNGYLLSNLTAKEARSDQIRLFGDTQRARSGRNHAKIFSSQLSTYQGNLVIDLDDNALHRIAEGAYTLDDFDRHDVRGVILRYVSANNEKVDLTRSPIGRSANYSNSDRDYNRRDVVDNGQPQRRLASSRANDRDRQGDGDWYLPDSDRGSRSNRITDRRDSRDNPNRISSLRRDYQDRMSDTYRDDTVGSRDRFIDRREGSRYQGATIGDRLDNSRSQRALLEESKLELDVGFAELSQWQRDLVKETRKIAERRRQLELEQRRAEALPVNDVNRGRYETAANRDRDNRFYERDRLRDFGSPLTPERYADSRNTDQNIYATSNLGSYATPGLLGDPNDPRFAQYAKNNLDMVARLNQKFAAMQQANELAALENKVDNEYQKQQLQLAQAKLNNGGRTVKTFIDDGEVRNTLGGNMAAGGPGHVGDRYAANIGGSYQNNGGVADMSMRAGRQDLGQQSASTGASDKLVRALWFIALLSIGMNMYLALLARSFYSRYNELADELRETFTSSVDYSMPTRSSRSLRSSESGSALAHRAT